MKSPQILFFRQCFVSSIQRPVAIVLDATDPQITSITADPWRVRQYSVSLVNCKSILKPRAGDTNLQAFWANIFHFQNDHFKWSHTLLAIRYSISDGHAARCTITTRGHHQITTLQWRQSDACLGAVFETELLLHLAKWKPNRHTGVLTVKHVNWH